jgi:hypothetical protein
MTTFAPATNSDAWLACAEMAVLEGLTAANRRLMRQQSRSIRHHSNGLRNTEPWTWHTIIPTEALREADVDALLADSLAMFDATAFRVNPVVASCLRIAIVTYLRTVIGAGIEHKPELLARMVEQARCLEDETSAA